MSGKSPEELQKLLKQMKEWISNEPDLPQNLEDRFLTRFLHSCYYDIENTQKAIKLFFKIRASLPEMMTNRDPLSQEIKKTINILNYARLHIDGKTNLFIWQLNDPGLEQYVHSMDVKLFLLNTDSWLMEDNRLEDQDIIILDAKDVTLKYITKCNLSLQRKYFKYMQEAMPIRLEQIHVVNIPPFFDKIYTILKPLLKKEIRKKVYLHTPNSVTLFDHISKENLPRDLGGTFGTMKEHMNEVLASMMRTRDILKQDNLWTANEKKNLNAENTEREDEDINDIRKLVID